MTAAARLPRLIFTIVGIAFISFYLFPFLWMVSGSFMPLTEMYSSTPHLFPQEITFQAYIDNFVKSQQMLKHLGNSFIIALGTMVLALALAIPTSYGLARLQIKGKSLIMILLLASQMFPSIMLAIPYFIVFSKIGLVNSYVALMIANTTNALPFAVLVLRPYFLTIPGNLEEAALIDGCNKFSAFARIILPLARTGILTVGTFSFLYGWGDFLFALTLTNKDAIRPLTLGLYKFISQYGQDWNGLMAVATIASLPIMFVFIFLQRYIVSGIASGSVKE